MATRIGINGFGRIGRQVTRAIIERYSGHLDLAAINDLTDAPTNAHLFKYDTNYGIYPGVVKGHDNNIEIDGKPITVFSERDPANIPWHSLDIDIVVESTGIFTDANEAKAHVRGGAKKVIISAPAKGEDLTVVMGVNSSDYDPDKHTILSNASCTTNCFAPMVKVLDDSFGVEYGLMTTVHSYTNDQKILDQVHSDMRRARSAAMNIIPTNTGAAKAVGLVLPSLSGKLHGMALRVPTATVSVTDLVAILSTSATPSDINHAYQKAAQQELKDILDYCEDPLVSSDFKGNPHSCVIDALSTMVMEDRMVKVLGWYDNEWGYSCRTADLCYFMSCKGF